MIQSLLDKRLSSEDDPVARYISDSLRQLEEVRRELYELRKAHRLADEAAARKEPASGSKPMPKAVFGELIMGQWFILGSELCVKLGNLREINDTFANHFNLSKCQIGYCDPDDVVRLTHPPVHPVHGPNGKQLRVIYLWEDHTYAEA